MYRYLLFDLDGTLTDSAEGIIKCVQYSAEKMGAPYKDFEELRVFVGPPLSESFQKVYGFSEEETKQAIVYYRERFKPIGMFENAVYDGIPEMLKTMPWGLLLAIGWIGFGGAMGIVEVLAHRK